jgi:hypothetical protein
LQSSELRRAAAEEQARQRQTQARRRGTRIFHVFWEFWMVLIYFDGLNLGIMENDGLILVGVDCAWFICLKFL